MVQVVALAESVSVSDAASVGARLAVALMESIPLSDDLASLSFGLGCVVVSDGSAFAASAADADDESVIVDDVAEFGVMVASIRQSSVTVSDSEE